MRPLQLAGKRFGRLIAIEIDGKCGTFNRWRCKCDCGNEVSTSGVHLTRGNTKSCGCYHREAAAACHRTHGMFYTPEYGIWTDMHQRCKNKKRSHYKHYGARGIAVCKAWSKFEPFFRDMGKRPSPSHSLDRRDNDKGYSKSNCRWATIIQQARNRRTNRMETVDGITKCVAEWADESGIPMANIFNRLYRGWEPKDAIFTPLNPANGRAA